MAGDLLQRARPSCMTLPCGQCMNRRDAVCVPGACLARGRIIGASQAGHMRLLCLEVRAPLPSQIGLQVTPEPLEGIQLWAARREP
jgi:hypothetical protein